MYKKPYKSIKNKPLNYCSELLSKTEAGKRKIRLVGVSVCGLENETDEREDKQMIFNFNTV